jgi:PAS domain S-box-containing protein
MFRIQPILTACCVALLTASYGQISQYKNHHIDSLRSELASANDTSSVDILNQISYNFYYYNLDSTDDYAQKSIELAESIGYLKGLCEAQRLMGISAKAQNREKEAYEWLYKGLETAQSIDYQQGIADNLNCIGIFFTYAEDYDRAIDYYQRSVESQILAKNKLREGLLYTNIGSAYLKQNKTDSAKLFLDKSKVLLDSIGDGRWLAMIYSQYGALAIQMNDLILAESLSERALELSLAHGQTMHLRKSYQNLAEVFLVQNRYDQSLVMAEEALHLSLEIGFIPYLIDNYEVLYKIHKAQNDIHKALYFHERYSQYRDSLRLDQMKSEADLINFEKELERKERENEALMAVYKSQEAENLARETIIQRQTIYGIGISVILIFVSFVAFILFRLRQKERSANKKLVETNKDIAEQKEELMATLKMLEILNAQMQAQNNALNQSAIVSFTDLSGNIISVNDNFCKVSGYEREELIGENKRILTSGEHDKKVFEDMWDKIINGENWRGELKNKKKNGDYFWVDTAISPVLDDNGKPKQFFSLQFEISKRKNYLDELTAKSHELEDLNQLKDKLLSIVSHDFRSPLNSLQGTLSLMLKGTIDQGEFKVLANALVDKLDHTSNLLDNLLNWAKSQMQGMRVYPKMINLQTVAEDCSHLLSSIAEKKMLNIQNNINNHQKVFADNEMVKLVFRNLLSNAIKFSHSRGSIFIDSLVENGHIVVSVKDQGLGISNENQDKIFKYENVSTYGTANEKGMGLGLLLCKDFIERNGGSMWFESELEKGSTFYFSLPTKEKTPQ